MPGGIVTDRMDNRNIEDRDLKKRIELLERNLESTKNDLIDTKNDLGAFKKIVDDLTKLIDSRIKIYMDKLNRDNSNEKLQTESVESKKIENNEVEEKDTKEEISEIKEKKLDISKFIEVFSQEFNFINKDEFNEEMENDEIMGKIIEKIKSAFVSKDNEIENKTKEIVKLSIKKNELESDIKTLNSCIVEKENKNNLLENKKFELEGKIENLNNKVNELENLKGNLVTDIETLKTEKNSLNIDLENKKKENAELELDKENLTDKNSKLIEEKEELNRENKEKDKKLEKFMKLFEEKENELKSIGDLLQAKKLYDKYLSMETRILSKLDNVLIQRDFESFISSGYNLSSLDNVWDIVKIEYKNISSEDKEILKEVFAFFLTQINKRFKEAKYGLVQVEAGEDFDAVNQVDLSQNSKGRVSECVFYGYGFLKEKENPDDEDIITRIIKSPLVLTV
ncbi:hypothetical protein RN96_12410 [Fusobacterium polymorphum]|uniref:Uncharacterized protein n=1 Tax=Fusobacterium nucleatum subsp. polymorphum TaxID=76857 RepID=A0A2B7YFP9_FUSNP|nr:hypothetical protein [Fusobacterium polymorphum]PGH19909.1 hypothetical protein RN96_12410 [Fusobacterium polymorphum]